MSDPVHVQLSRANPSQSWGFRLQGGADFSTPLSIQSVINGSLAQQRGIVAGDNILQIGNVSTESLHHDDAKQEIVRCGNVVDLILQRGSVKVWKPKVTQMTDLRGGQQMAPHPNQPMEDSYVQRTSLAADKQMDSTKINFYNRSARPFAPGGGSSSFGGGSAALPHPGGHSMAPQATSDKMPVVVNAQYNTPLGMYSTNNALDAFEQQSSSMVDDMGSSGDSSQQAYGGPQAAPAAPAGGATAPSGMRSVRAPTGPPPNVQIQPAQTMTCKACGSLIVGVFVKVRGESMHAECYKCVRCRKSLKQQGFFTIEGQLHCEPCAAQVSAPSGGDMVATAVYR